jgi:magnesium chelatase family protein
VRRASAAAVFANAQMGPKEVKQFCAIPAEAEKLLEMAVTKLGFSARAYDRVLKVARTIADLEGNEAIATHHISEAIQYRMMDRIR